MVRRGLATDVDAACEMIDAGRVLVGGAPAHIPQRLTDDGEPVRLIADRRFVGRGGDKLLGAFDEWALGEPAPGGKALDLDGRRALDVGSSTGGFTDCLLQSGVASVVAVDVGTHQLHERLREDPRVAVFEQTDIRALDPVEVDAPFAVVTVDVSFISVCSIIATLATLTAPDGDLIVLVKPQFEVSHSDASRTRGVIRDPELWRWALDTVSRAAHDSGLSVAGATVSSVRGAQGNTEFFVRFRHRTRHGATTAEAPMPDDEWIDAVLASVEDADRRAERADG